MRCNTFVKFDLLLERARRLGAERLATGHYARIVDGPDGPELHAAADPAKDQSYYLFELAREQLARLEFPLGAMSKPEVREIARAAGLAVAEKGESMEVCFVDGGGARVRRARGRGAPGSASARRAGAGAAWSIAAAPSSAAASPTTATPSASVAGLGLAAGERRYVLEVLPAAERRGGGRRPRARGAGSRRRAAALDRVAARRARSRRPVRIRSRHPGVEARIRPRRDGASRGRLRGPPARRRAGAGGGLLRRQPGARRLLDHRPALTGGPHAEG